MIEKRFKSAEMQAKLVQLVKDSKASVQNTSTRASQESKWADFYKLYRGTKDASDYKSRANLDWASAFIAIETLIPRIHSVLFPRNRWFEVLGVEEFDYKNAQIIESYLRVVLDKDVHFSKKMIPALRYCAIYGTIILKTPFRHESKQVPVKRNMKKNKTMNIAGIPFTVPFSNENVIEFDEDTVVTFDSIDAQLVDIFNFYVADDTITNIEDQPFVIQCTQEYMSSLRKNEYDEEDNPYGLYENVDEIQHLNEDSYQKNGEISNNNNNVLNRMADLGIAPKRSYINDRLVQIDEYQGVVDIDEDGNPIDMIIAVANDDILLTAEELNTPDKEKTYVKGVWNEMPEEFWGMGVIERVEKSIYELDDRVNQTMDATALIINPMWLNVDAYIPEGKLRVFPGAMYKSVSKDGLTPLRPPTEILNPAYTAIQTLTSMIQDTTGATRFLGGSAQVPELQRTATGIMSIIKEANARLNLVVQGLEDDITKPFLRKAYKYTQFYSERTRIIRVTGKHGMEYVEFDPKSIVSDVDFRPLGSQSVGSEEVKTQQMINFMNIIAQMPPQLAGQIDIMRLVRNIAETMFGMEDADELIVTNGRKDEQIEKAISENVSAAQGFPPVVDMNDNHRLHVQIHSGFLQDKKMQASPQSIQLLQSHVSEHEQLVSLQGTQVATSIQEAQSSGGVPPQSQPSPTTTQDVVNQTSQPSQSGGSMR